MKKTLRVIQVINVRWFNATAWYALFISRLLQEAGHEVLVLALPGTPPVEIGRKWGLKVVELPLNVGTPKGIFRLWHSFKGIVHEFKPDVVNCHRGENFVLWGLLQKALPTFALVRTRGDQRPPKKNIFNVFLHKHLADALVATNSVTAGEFVNSLGCKEQQVSMVVGGVDTATFCFDAVKRANLRKEYGFLPEHFVLGFVGRFDNVKGIHELISVLGELVRRYGERLANLRLLLVGFSSQISTEQVMFWAKEEGLGERTVITGRHPDVVACMSAMDAGVITSQGSEAVARVAFEMMSCGLPLVSTGVGVMPDLLPEHALSPVGDTGALSNLLARLLLEKEWREHLREECLCRIATLSEQDFLHDTLHVYQKALEHHRQKLVS